MKKHFLLIITMCLLFSSCASSNLCRFWLINDPNNPHPACVDIGGGEWVLKTEDETFDSKKGMFVYENSTYGFSINYPPQWVKRELPEEHEFTVHFFPAPAERSSYRMAKELKPPQVMMRISPLVKWKTLGEFKSGVMKETGHVASNFSILSEVPITVAGFPAAEFYTTAELVKAGKRSDVIKSWSVLTTANGYGYIFSYANTVNGFDSNFPEARKIFESWSISDKSGDKQ